MKAPKATARFAQVVQAAGQPEPVTLWVEPRQDKKFQAAVRENRVMTVNQETVGTKKDFGVVGFHPGKNVSYWLFPQPLDAFEGKRIIGIDYKKLKVSPLVQAPEPRPHRRPRETPASSASEEPVSSSAPPTPDEPSPRERPAPKAPIPPPAVFRFRVRVAHVSTVEVTTDVEAANRSEAKAKALEAAAASPLDFAKGRQQRRVTRVEKLGRR